jgi:hypothetical protein
MLEERVGEKFGDAALAAALAVSRARTDADGGELSREERHAELVARIATTNATAQWVLAANHVHSGNAVLADLRRTVDPTSVWSRVAGGRASTIDAHRDVLAALESAGFQGAIIEELRATVRDLSATPAA